MATELELLQDIKELLKNGNRGGGGRGSYGGGSSTPSGGGGDGGGINVGGLAGAGKNVVDGMDALWRGTLTTASGFETLNRAIGNAGGKLGDAFSDISRKLGGAMLDTNDAVNKSLKQGANFGNDLSEYDKLIKGARMTHEEYNDMLKNSAEEMRGLGSNINTSQKNFLMMAKAFQEGDVGNRLKELGMHAEDLNEVMAATMANRRGMDMSDPATKKAAIESSEKLLMATEEIARLTGESRKDQLEALKKHDTDAQIQMKISMLDKQAKERFDAGMAQMHMLGPAAEKVFRDTFLGKITKEGSAAIAATGTSAADIQRYALASQRGTTPEEQAQAAELGKTAINRNVEWQNSTGAKNFGMYNEGAGADMVRQQWLGSTIREPINAKIDEAKNRGETIDAATAYSRMTADERKAMAPKSAEEQAKEPAGAKVATTINKADRKLSDLSAGMTEQFGGLVDQTGKLISDFGSLDKILAPMTQEEAGLSSLVKEFVSSKSLPDALKDARADQTHEKTTAEQMAAPVKPVEKRANGSPSLDGFLNGAGSFDSMFEHFDPAGTPAELHGEELVATRKQMEKFVEKIIPTPKMAQSTPEVPTLPPIPPIDFKNVPTAEPQNKDQAVAASVINENSSKILAQSLNSVSDQLKSLSAALHDFKPLDHVNQVVEKVTAAQKPATPPPAAPAPTVLPKKESAADIAKAALASQATSTTATTEKKEEKPAEVKKEEPKLLNLGIKSAEDLNKFIFGGMPQPKEPPKEDKDKLMEQGKTAESFFKDSTMNPSDIVRDTFNKMAANPFDKFKTPDTDESQIKKALDQHQSTNPAFDAIFKHIDELNKSFTGPLTDISANTKIEPKELPIDNMFSKLSETFKMPDLKMPPELTTLPKDLMQTQEKSSDMFSKNFMMYSDSTNMPDLNDTFKTLSDNLGDTISTTLPELDNSEQLKEMSESFKTTDFNAMFSDMNELLPTVIPFENEDEEDTKEDEITPADTSTPSNEDLSKREILFQSPTMTMYDESEEKKQQRKEQQAAANDKSPGIFDSISNFFTSSNKPAFASGNVKYEEIPQAEIDAKNKRMQESIGKIDNSPEAIAAQKAELDRQKNSGMYKQKEPEKPKVEEVKKPAESKEDAHVKEMYKKFGLETFKDYNARVSAEVKQSHAQIKDAAINKKELSPKDVAPPPAAPAPKPVEQVQPAPQPQQQPKVIEKEVTLKDIHEALLKLNKTMGEMAHHTDQISNNSHKQVSATKQLSNSRW